MSGAVRTREWEQWGLHVGRQSLSHPPPGAGNPGGLGQPQPLTSDSPCMGCSWSGRSLTVWSMGMDEQSPWWRWNVAGAVDQAETRQWGFSWKVGRMGGDKPQLSCHLSSRAWDPLCRDTREEGLPVGCAVSPLILSSDSQTFVKGVISGSIHGDPTLCFSANEQDVP